MDDLKEIINLIQKTKKNIDSHINTVELLKHKLISIKRISSLKLE